MVGLVAAPLEGSDVFEGHGTVGRLSLDALPGAVFTLSHCAPGMSLNGPCRCHGLAPLDTSCLAVSGKHCLFGIFFPGSEEAPNLAILDNPVCPLSQLFVRALPSGG